MLPSSLLPPIILHPIPNNSQFYWDLGEAKKHILHALGYEVLCTAWHPIGLKYNLSNSIKFKNLKYL
jgi:hypothetical protein